MEVIKNTYAVEYKDGFIIAITRNDSLLFPAQGNEVAKFATAAELDKFITSNNLQEYDYSEDTELTTED